VKAEVAKGSAKAAEWKAKAETLRAKVTKWK
jgi:hypothetical protein